MTGTTARGDFPFDPAYSYAPVIYKRRKWADPWELAPELRLERAAAATAAHGEAEILLRRSYGSISQIYEIDWSTVEPEDLAGWWVRLDLVGPDGPTTQWVGRILAEPREIEGADLVDDAGDPIRSGEQCWLGFGPQTLADRVWISTSRWDGDEVGGSGGTIRLGWLPGINARDKRGLILGNRSQEKSAAPSGESAYLYGNQADWTYRQYAEYLLAFFLDERDRLDADDNPDPGPAWALSGQVDLLDGLTAVLDLDPVESIGALLRRLIAPALGVDYRIRYVEDMGSGSDGFDVQVFALLGEEVRFAGATLPKNPDSITYTAGAEHWQTRTIVERRKETEFNVVRILGRRAVVCLSLAGADCPITEIADTLRPKWSTGLQTQYQAGAGAAAYFGPEDHDRARQDARFDSVFAVWGAPADWDQLAHGSLYRCDYDGLFWPGGIDPDTPYQNAVRSTLDWTPLKRGVNYETDPPTDCNPSGACADWEPPTVWIKRLPLDYVTWGYERADQKGIGVSPLDHDWGVKLAVSPNHLIAVNQFLATRPTRTAPLYEDRYMVATIAIESDHRPTAEMVIDYVEGQADRPSDGILEIYDEAVETWILAPYTVVGLDPTGELVNSGPQARLLREDSQRIHLVLAGAIARHQRGRARAEIQAEGLLPWADLLGRILAAVEEAGDTHDVQAPLTSIEWSLADDGTARTVIRTGFAQSAFSD